MSKPKDQAKEQPKTSPVIYSYSVARKDSGYYITKHSIQDSKVIKTEQVSEPDVLVICMANLEKFVRKDHGL